VSNTNEFLTGTDPTNSASAFRITSVTKQGTNVLVSWTMGAGKTNALQVTSGNPGGGIGGLRLMSYLTPGKLPIGYSLTRRRAKDGFERENLTKFGRIPMRKIELLPLAVRFAFAEKSIALVTEGLGPQPFHGAIAVLVNEHTASASEMIAAFAAENRLATIVGTKTAGRLLSGDSFKLPHGYVLTLPVGAYYTWGGRLLEGAGVSPDVTIESSYYALRAGSDNQLEAALDTVDRL